MKKGSTRTKNITNVCEYCKNDFRCCDPKNRICDNCRVCKICGKNIKRPKERRQCLKCQKKNLTQKQKDQLKQLHESILGDNNPAKKPEVRKKLSEGKKGVLNPAHKYPEQWRQHIAKYRPTKSSKLEDLIAPLLSSFDRQVPVAWYKIDFAKPSEKIGIEVQGCWHHSCQICFPGSPTHKTQRHNRGNDLRKNKFLTHLGWKLIYLAEHEIRNKSDTDLQEMISILLQ